MRTESRNRLVVTRAAVSARHEPLSNDAYAWIWVLPIPNGKFRIALIEVPKHLIDNEECFYELDLTTRFLRVVDTIDEVDDAVRAAGADPDALEAPWHNDFPL